MEEPAPDQTAVTQPPEAAKKEHITRIHGVELKDDYFWLRERENPDVIAYLEAENAYTDAAMAGTRALQKSLYDEMLARMVEDDASVPHKDGEYWYYYRTESGKPHRIYCRKKGHLEAKEEILLDGNDVAEGHDYMVIAAVIPSPDHSVLAWFVAYAGSERYELRFENLTIGERWGERIPDTDYSGAWASDNKTYFYIVVDEANRPFKLMRHVLGTDPREDVEVLVEEDDAYYLSAWRTRSGAFIIASLDSAVTSEVHYLDAGRPTDALKLVAPRRQGVEYSVEHHGERFLILTNEEALNFKLMETPVSAPGREHWKEVIPHSEEITLQSILAFRDHLVIYERESGLTQLRVRRLADGEEHRIAVEARSYDLYPESNAEFATTVLRYELISLSTPESVFDYDMDARTANLKKQKPVNDYRKEDYEEDRIWARAKDGTKVPISLLHKKGLRRDGSAPLLLNGYGSYGASSDPEFSSDSLILVDRGFVVAIAHIRGGGEMGRRWKEDGKLDNKMNTFTDYIACAEHLVAEGYTSPRVLVAAGGSAGGLLMGAVVNLRPDLFAAVLALVPFVDVVNTMLDETIPLTVTEWEEWGNPNDEQAFHNIRAYSPYDNTKAQAYPAMLIKGGLNDPRVQYWEPAKWTARLRVLNTGSRSILLKTDMASGHGGASGRYGRLQDKAFNYAFILDQIDAVTGGGDGS